MYRSKYLHVYFSVQLYLKKRDHFCEGMKTAHSFSLLLKAKETKLNNWKEQAKFIIFSIN